MICFSCFLCFLCFFFFFVVVVVVVQFTACRSDFDSSKASLWCAAEWHGCGGNSREHTPAPQRAEVAGNMLLFLLLVMILKC